MGRAPCCDKANVKKGSWSPDEDAKLKAYIQQHGTGGNWIALPQKIGLKRCGKSCRLRWLNYLRPNIKHGEFTKEEDDIICTLYLSIGSRWSIIAAQLPGRTDNDIKNYWNTKLKKKLLGTKQRRDRRRHHHHHHHTQEIIISNNERIDQTVNKWRPLPQPPWPVSFPIHDPCEYPMYTMDNNNNYYSCSSSDNYLPIMSDDVTTAAATNDVFPQDYTEFPTEWLYGYQPRPLLLERFESFSTGPRAELMVSSSTITSASSEGTIASSGSSWEDISSLVFPAVAKMVSINNNLEMAAASCVVEDYQDYLRPLQCN